MASITTNSNSFDSDKASIPQRLTILICFLMNILDGMDVMVISYASPAIAKELAVTSPQLGVILSAGLLGMTVGTLFLAPRADIFGRRALILFCALLMGTTVFSTFLAQSFEHLVFFRFISGLGIGGMLPIAATLTAEYAPRKIKDFWVSFVMSGYPIGAVLSGMAAAKIIPAYGWRAMFQTAGICTLSTLPIIYFFLSESIDFLLKRQPTNALARANSVLSAMNQPTLTALPLISEKSIEKTAISSLFVPERKLSTTWLWIALFGSFAAMYYLVTWIPKLASSAGLSMELAIYAGTVFNLGAFVGILTQGYLSSNFGLRRTICGFLVSTAILMSIFSFFKGSSIILVLFGLIGFAIQGGFVGLYAVAARLYPTEIRSTGVGWAMGAGRVGAIISPMIGGVLTGMGLSMATNFLIFAVPALLAGIATMMIRSSEIR